jgi:hypothetical protein
MTPFSQQPTIPPCAACGGRRVTGKDTIHLGLGEVRLTAGNTPLAGTAVVVCTNCGQITLYADNLARLHEAIQKHPDHFRW